MRARTNGVTTTAALTAGTATTRPTLDPRNRPAAATVSPMPTITATNWAPEMPSLLNVLTAAASPLKMTPNPSSRYRPAAPTAIHIIGATRYA